MSDLDRIKERIRALLQMTEANGCTEAEAMAAAERAMALMAKHGFSAADIERDHGGRPTPGKRRGVADSLWPVVAEVCRCRGYLDGGAHGAGRLEYVYFGAPQDVAVAVYLHQLLAGAVRRETEGFRARPEYTRRRKAGTRSQAVRAFQEGMVLRLKQRLRRLWWQRLNAGGDCQAVLAAEQAHRERLLKELEGQGIVLAGLPRLRGHKRGSEDALWAGWATAGQVSIDPGVSGAGPRGLLDAGQGGK